MSLNLEDDFSRYDRRSESYNRCATKTRNLRGSRYEVYPNSLEPMFIGGESAMVDSEDNRQRAH